MSSKIDDYYALQPATFTRLERLSIVPSQGLIADAVDLDMEVGRDDGVTLVLSFTGVTSFKVDDLRASRPDCFEIIDMRAERGWERDMRYAVSDCCQGPITFHCADFEASVRAR
jgi:hypothetical protein